MIHVRAVVLCELNPLSSPRQMSFGRSAARKLMIACSLSRSAAETQSLRAFVCASSLPRCSQYLRRTAAPRRAASIPISTSFTARILLDRRKRPSRAPAFGYARPHPMDHRRISHYRVDRLIGVGGMGEVYLAEDATLQRKVALKL